MDECRYRNNTIYDHNVGALLVLQVEFCVFCLPQKEKVVSLLFVIYTFNVQILVDNARYTALIYLYSKFKNC